MKHREGVKVLEVQGINMTNIKGAVLYAIDEEGKRYDNFQIIEHMGMKYGAINYNTTKFKMLELVLEYKNKD